VAPRQRRSTGHTVLIIIGGICSGLILPIAATLFTQSLSSAPHIDTSAAHEFLNQYYGSVTESSDEWYDYQNELTPNFRTFPGHDWRSYKKFWRTWHKVTVNSLIPVQGNPVEFTISIGYHYNNDQTVSTETVNVWLACNSNYILARLPWGGCKASHLEIDSTQDATGGTDSGAGQ
jgi:hypothetical protein